MFMEISGGPCQHHVALPDWSMLAIPLQNLPLLLLTWKIIVWKCMGGFWLLWFATSFDALRRWKRVLHAWGSPATNSHRVKSQIVHTANPTIIRTIQDTMTWLLHQTRKHFIISPKMFEVHLGRVLVYLPPALVPPGSPSTSAPKS